jgi:hypothetical protein
MSIVTIPIIQTVNIYEALESPLHVRRNLWSVFYSTTDWLWLVTLLIARFERAN